MRKSPSIMGPFPPLREAAQQGARPGAVKYFKTARDPGSFVTRFAQGCVFKLPCDVFPDDITAV